MSRSTSLGKLDSQPLFAHTVNSSQRYLRTRGFSLIELLSVMAIIAIMASALSLSLKPSLSLQFQGEVDSLAGTLKSARQLAVCKNTYIWVVLRQADQGRDRNVEACVVESADGSDPIPWGSHVDLTAASPTVDGNQNAPLRMTLKPTRLRDIVLENLTTLPETAPTSDIDDGDRLAVQNATNRSQFKIPVNGQSQTFDFVIRFSPSGQVVAQQSPVKFIEIGLKPARPGSLTSALLRIGALTGRTEKYL